MVALKEAHTGAWIIYLHHWCMVYMSWKLYTFFQVKHKCSKTLETFQLDFQLFMINDNHSKLNMQLEL